MKSSLSDLKDNVECKANEVAQASRELEQKRQESYDGLVGLIPSDNNTDNLIIFFSLWTGL